MRTTYPWPLAIHPSGRYLVDNRGRPFPLLMDSATSGVVQLTRAQADTYLDTRRDQGFTGFELEAIEHQFSDNTPKYRNTNGDDPFLSMTDFSLPNEAYWKQVDYWIAGAYTRGLLVALVLAYTGFPGASPAEGWSVEFNADTAAHLQAYGAFIANRYRNWRNVMFMLGGDSSDAGNLTKQANILTGIRSVRTDDLVTMWGQRTSNDGYADASAITGFNVNSIYTLRDTSDLYTDANTAYTRSPVMPFWCLEMNYEGDGTTTASEVRCACIAPLLAGACGSTYYHNKIWPFGADSGAGSIGAATALSTYLSTTGITEVRNLRNVWLSKSWWLGQPKAAGTDSSFITTSLGSGATRLYAAVSSDRSWAMVYTRGAGFTLDMTNFVQASVRARWYDATNDTFTDASGTPFANTGTQAFTPPGGGERLLVLD